MDSLSLEICKAMGEKKASNIVVMKMEGVTTDYFVICDAATSTQVRAIADNVAEKVAGLNHREGGDEWILLDFGDAVAHIFKTAAREFYALEKLWGDSEVVQWFS